MDCKRVRKVMFLVVDNEIESELLTSFRSHLAVCPGCARRVDYTRQVILIFRQRCGRAAAPAGLRQRILTSLPHRSGSVGESLE